MLDIRLCIGHLICIQLIFSLAMTNIAEAGNNGLVTEKLKLMLGFDSKLSISKTIKRDQSEENLVLEWVQAFKEQGARIICRRPGLYELLRQSGEISGQPVDGICPSLLFVTSEGERQVFQFKDVMGLKYIVAGKGDEMGSRFGHAMIGILTCPQSNSNCVQANSQATPADYTEYIAGFVARTLGSYSLVGGLRGTYPTQVTFNYAANVRKKYLYEDFRSMISVPLNLNSDQIRLFVYLLEERFWFYHNRYKFINNNCASEVLRLMKLVLPSGNPIDRVSSSFLTPMRLLKRLVAIGVGQLDQLEDLQNKVPNIDHYILNTIGKNFSMEGYFKMSPSERRDLFLAHFFQLKKDQVNNEKTPGRSGLFQWKILEKAALRNLATERDKFLWDWLADQHKGSNKKDQLSCYKSVSLRKGNLIKDPIYFSSRLLAGDYVPTPTELVPLDLKKSANERGAKLLKDIAICAEHEEELQTNQALQSGTLANLQTIEHLLNEN